MAMYIVLSLASSVACNRGYPLVGVSEVPRLTFWEVGVIVEHWVVYSIQ